MAIRIRTVHDQLVALCAARSTPRDGDLYLDDGIHYALAQKFWHDYEDYGNMPFDLADRTLRLQEEDDIERWEELQRRTAEGNLGDSDTQS